MTTNGTDKTDEAPRDASLLDSAALDSALEKMGEAGSNEQLLEHLQDTADPALDKLPGQEMLDSLEPEPVSVDAVPATAEEFLTRDDTLRVVIGRLATGQQRTVTIQKKHFAMMVMEGQLKQEELDQALTFIQTKGDVLKQLAGGGGQWMKMDTGDLNELLAIMRTFISAASVVPKFVLEHTGAPGTAPVTALKLHELTNIFSAIVREGLKETLESAVPGTLAAVGQ